MIEQNQFSNYLHSLPVSQGVDSPYMSMRVDYSDEAKRIFGVYSLVFQPGVNAWEICRFDRGKVQRESDYLMIPKWAVTDPFGQRAKEDGVVTLSLEGWVVKERSCHNDRDLKVVELMKFIKNLNSKGHSLTYSE